MRVWPFVPRLIILTRSSFSALTASPMPCFMKSTAPSTTTNSSRFASRPTTARSLNPSYAEVAEKLGAARVQMIGKLLIFWRPSEESDRQDPDEAARLAILSMKTASVAGKKETSQSPAKRLPLKATAKPAKKVASKKPGEKKKKTASPIPVRSRSKKNRVTKKGAGSRS